MPKLGVNIDHVATLRQARYKNASCGLTPEPDPVRAAIICEKAGCDSIVCHLREDRRHINDRDLEKLRRVVKTKLNLEMSIAAEIVDIARAVKPDQATLVPERRQEITTEGGLDAAAGLSRIKRVVRKLQDGGIVVSLFIDPDRKQIMAARQAGAEFIELHTGKYANAGGAAAKKQLEILKTAVRFAQGLRLRVNAGHGLNYLNAARVARIPGVEELNIGHSIISRSVFCGLDEAVREMLKLVSQCR